jgi:predicted RNA-binding Zn ribbon-like protein
MLARAPVRWSVVATPDGRALVETPRVEGAGDLVGVVALEVARLVAREDLERVKPCAGPDCTLWFLDRTNGGRRRFCSAAACGNRAKVAAFRERQRGG